MVKRIKYIYDKDGVGTSKQTFEINGLKTRVMLDTKKFKFMIVDETTGDIIKTGGNTKKGNLHVLKRQVKQTLEDLGVNFGIEVN